MVKSKLYKIFILFILFSCTKSVNDIHLSYLDSKYEINLLLNQKPSNKGFYYGQMRLKNISEETLAFNMKYFLLKSDDIILSAYFNSIIGFLPQFQIKKDELKIIEIYFATNQPLKMLSDNVELLYSDNNVKKNAASYGVIKSLLRIKNDRY